MKILIYWKNFPISGLIVTNLIRKYNTKVITETKKRIPCEYNEILDNLIFFKKNSFPMIKFSEYDVVIVYGWRNPFILLKSIYRSITSNKITIIAADNIIIKSKKQFLKAKLFSPFLKFTFKFALTPGKLGVEYFKMIGYSENRILTGMYGAYESIFYKSRVFSNRNNEFLFVGQLIDRKSIIELLRGFESYRTSGGQWGLTIVGEGYHERLVREFSNNSKLKIKYLGYQSPTNISKLMNKSKVFVLLSKIDHWATVVCEAAACGMAIYLSKGVGAHADLLDSNGIIDSRLDEISIASNLFYFENLYFEELERMSMKSKQLAINYNSQAYTRMVESVIERRFL